MSDPWAEFEEVTPQSALEQSGGPQPILSRSSPSRDLENTSKEVGIETSLSGEARADRKEAKDISDTAFTQQLKLANDFASRPATTSYQTIIGAYAKSLGTEPNSAGDQALITNYAKMLDPDSVVREGEFATVAEGDNAVNQLRAKIQKEGGFGGGGMLLPEYRVKLRTEMQNLAATSNKAYRQERERYSGLATRFGFDPDVVVGPHAGEPFKDDIERYFESIQDGAKTPESRGGLPIGTDIEFDRQPGFDRAKWLDEQYGITPNQEAQIVAFMNENRGNQSITAQDIKDYYKSIGAPFDVIVSDSELEDLRTGRVGYGPYDSSTAEQEREARKAELMASRDSALGEVDASIRGIADMATLGLSDKMAAVGDTVVSGGTYADNLENQRMISEADVEVNPIGRTTGQVIGGAMLPIGAGARTAAELAKVGGASGAAYEFNTTDGDLGQRLTSAATGGLIGAAGGGTLGTAAPIAGKAIRGVAAKLPKRSTSGAQREFVDAANAEDLDFMLADVPGKTAAKYSTGLSGVTLGGIPIRDAATKMVEKAGAARDRIAGNLGSVGDDASAGQAVKRGVEAWEKKTAGRSGELYRKIPIKDDVPAQVSETQGALKELNAGLKSNPELSEQIADPTMKRYQAALEKGGLSWADLKKFRSYIGEKAGLPTFQQDTSKDSLDTLYGALSRDMEATASASGSKALDAFKRANTYYRAMQTRRTDVMKKLVGNKLDISSEATFKQMQSWGKSKGGDYARFSQALRSLPDDEANAVRAAFIDRLGNEKAGMPSSQSDTFSPAKFLTQYRDLSGRAKAVLFKGEHKKSLDNLATVFEGMGDAQAFTNPSKTSIGSFAIGTAALAGSNPIAGALAAGGQYLSGKLLSSPGFAKWMTAGLKKPNPSAQLAHINKLSSVAKANPAIADDVFQLQSRLAEAFAATPQKAAAEDTPQSETTRTIPGPQ